MNRAFRDVVRWRSNVAHLQSSPKTISSSEIRKTFLDYFCEENDHLYIRSSPVFSLKDPTLAFTNAGMNQFKGVFLGIIQPPAKRVANSQKCIRIGGIHNDLNQVGEDGIHHTFFEMLGNWSFGDYFKEESCRMSWDLLTKVFNIPPERLYVTYFKGDQALGLGPDFEVKEIWQKIGVESSHILPFGAQKNFWSGGVTGPCGPCTEIHYNASDIVDASNLVNSSSGAVTELWNLVFTQYDRNSENELTKLNTHFVDTGMGFERLVAVLQGKLYNYDTDLFLPLFEVIKNHTGHSGYTGKYNGNTIDNGYRVLADHSRLITVSLSDGMLPNQQRKLRGIMKKTFTVIEKTFNAKEDLLKELTVKVAESLSDVYPEIEKNLSKIHYIIEEEADLIKTKQEEALNRWVKIKKTYPALKDLDISNFPDISQGLNYITERVFSKGKKSLTNEDIFVLFETYGIHAELLKEVAKKLDLQFDVIAYEKYERLKKQDLKNYTREKFLHTFKEYSYLDILAELEKKEIQPTLDYFKYDYRVDGCGKYIFEEQSTTVEAILLDNKLVKEISAEDIQEVKEIGIILDRTQLFSEEGGQACDFGTLTLETDIIFDIEKVVKIKNYVIHFGCFRNFPRDSKVAVQNIGIVKLNEDRRRSIMQNHTALHLLNCALRHELGITGEKFSSVTPEKLSLKFMVYKNTLSNDEGIKNVEKFVNEFILHGVSVNRKIYNLSEFQNLNDVVLIPGEVILEREIPVIEINSGFKLTREYCPGTHVLNTSDLKDFVITKHIKGSYYVTHIEAVTGEKCSEIRKADSELNEKWSCLKKKINECSSSNPSEVSDLLLKVKEIFLETSETDITHYTKFALNKEFFQAKISLNALMKTSVRNFLTEEITKASAATSEKFVVLLFLDCSWNFDPIYLEEAAASACKDKPLIFFFKRENLLSVQCIVPEAFVSDKFSARLWLVDSLITLCGKASCRKHQNPDLMYFINDVKVTEAQLRQVMNVAVELAKKNIEN